LEIEDFQTPQKALLFVGFGFRWCCQIRAWLYVFSNCPTHPPLPTTTHLANPQTKTHAKKWQQPSQTL
jgi:hypothetical protein